MDLVVWIGRRAAPPQLAALLAEHSVELRSYPDAIAAVAATYGQRVAVAIVTYDADSISTDIGRFTAIHSEAQVLAASDAGVPRNIVLALCSGASGVLEFKSQSKAEIVEQVREWVGRHHRGHRERELLLRLRALNEDFLKHIVAAQKRNLELEEQLKTEAEDAGGDDEKPRVLVVDDEEVVRGVLQAVLARKGYPHSVVHTGEAAVQAVQRERFQLVITDKNLPGISGLDVLRAVKEHSPDTDVIMMTGYASMDSAIEALNLGASGYLEKPFEHVKLVVEKIESVMNARREKLRHRRYLVAIKEKNRTFLDQYRAVRADLEAWLATLGVDGVMPPQDAEGSPAQPRPAPSVEPADAPKRSTG